jgi:hypothetical protein
VDGDQVVDAFPSPVAGEFVAQGQTESAVPIRKVAAADVLTPQDAVDVQPFRTVTTAGKDHVGQIGHCGLVRAVDGRFAIAVLLGRSQASDKTGMVRSRCFQSAALAQGKVAMIGVVGQGHNPGRSGLLGARRCDPGFDRQFVAGLAGFDDLLGRLRRTEHRSARDLQSAGRQPIDPFVRFGFQVQGRLESGLVPHRRSPALVEAVQDNQRLGDPPRQRLGNLRRARGRDRELSPRNEDCRAIAAARQADAALDHVQTRFRGSRRQQESRAQHAGLRMGGGCLQRCSLGLLRHMRDESPSLQNEPFRQPAACLKRGGRLRAEDDPRAVGILNRGGGACGNNQTVARR